MTTSVDDFIKHYGTKGMRWGVRKRSGGKGGSSKTAYKKAPVRLSDAELNKRIKRMELEKKYSDLSSPKAFDGKKYAQGVLESSGKSVAAAVVGGTATFFVQKALKAKFAD